MTKNIQLESRFRAVRVVIPDGKGPCYWKHFAEKTTFTQKAGYEVNFTRCLYSCCGYPQYYEPPCETYVDSKSNDVGQGIARCMIKKPKEKGGTKNGEE